MVHLVKIGNSQGIRIPKPLAEQAKLEGKELKLQLVNKGLLITPVVEARDGWKEAIEGLIATQGQQPVDSEWLDASLISDAKLEW
ncbi:MAG: AbrB/MazE/SpoVT family DNA-binding domain-containing protein [Xanthomonadales bacterium]|nr:AbrB/MazE/SpoVT family DNA-binding domain-containing protein [Xanthomonadales bacterium]